MLELVIVNVLAAIPLKLPLSVILIDAVLTFELFS